MNTPETDSFVDALNGDFDVEFAELFNFCREMEEKRDAARLHLVECRAALETVNRSLCAGFDSCESIRLRQLITRTLEQTK